MKKAIAVLKIVGFAAFFVVWFMAFFGLAPEFFKPRDNGCEIYHRAYVQELKYRVIKKYIDTPNHAYWTVIYSTNNNKIGRTTFWPGLNLLFYNLQPGDSVLKKKNSMYYDLKSNKLMKYSIYESYIKCKDTLSAQKSRPDDSNN